MVVAEGFNLGLFGDKRLRSNCSIGVKQCLNDIRDWALHESSVVVDEIGKAVVIEGSVDLLNAGPLDEVAGFERREVLLVLSMRLQALNAVRLSLKSCLASSICVTAQFDKSGMTERIGRLKGTLGGIQL
jgi:hypothetical protein